MFVDANTILIPGWNFKHDHLNTDPFHESRFTPPEYCGRQSSPCSAEWLESILLMHLPNQPKSLTFHPCAKSWYEMFNCEYLCPNVITKAVVQVYVGINVDVVVSNGIFFVSYLWQHIIPVWQVQ